MTSIDEPRLQELLDAARDVRTNAYAPYSSFRVGAAVLTVDDRIMTGVNVENASYPVSMCAERGAVGSAVGSGARSLRAVAVVSGAGSPTPPCGACRQVLFEFGGKGMAVIAETPDGSMRTYWSLDELLPDAFGPDSLDR